MRVQIRLDTMRDAQNFVNIASKMPGAVYITDNAGLKVSAKSLLGALYAMEFSEPNDVQRKFCGIPSMWGLVWDFR